MKSGLIAVLFVLIGSRSFAIYVSNVSDILGNEQSVTHINLSNRGLKEVPAVILKCVNLVSLDLSNNGLVNLPDELAGMRNLTSLNLSQNRALNPISLERLFDHAEFRLVDLQLSECNLLFIPASVSEHDGLKVLNVAHNRLTTLPYNFMELENLESINVSSNKLRNVDWFVHYWWNLKTIDFSENDGLLASSVLSALSYADGLEEITLSHLDFIPKDAELLNVKKMTIKNSTVGDFYRTNVSTPIRQIYFENCIFKDASGLVNVLNEFVKPSFIHFSKMNPATLVEFLNLKADSIALFQLGSLDIKSLSQNKNLKWLDVRGNKLNQDGVIQFKKARPEVELICTEQVKPDFGVNPPVPEFVREFSVYESQAGVEQHLEMGQSAFDIAADGIVDAQGEVYKGPVSFEYREFMTPGEILLSGITMTSDKDDETFAFSSGGMFEINAKDPDGNELFVNPDKPIRVEMFSNSTNPDMEIFALNDSGVWVQTGADSIVTPFDYAPLEQDSSMTEDFVSRVTSQVLFVGHRYVPVVKKNRKMDSFEITFKEFKTRDLPKTVKFGTTSLEVHNENKIAKLLTSKRFLFEGKESEKIFNKIDSVSQYCQKKYRRLRCQWWRGDFYKKHGPDYISAISVLPDFENDRYNLTFKFKNEKFVLPVTLLSGEFEAAGSIRENKQFYVQYAMAWKRAKKMENSNGRKIKTEIQKRSVFLKRLANDEYARTLKLTYRDEYTRGEYAKDVVARSASLLFQIATFGIHNADARVRQPQPVPVSSEFVNEAMEKVKDKPNGIYVINHGDNSVVQFEDDQQIVMGKGTASTVVVFFVSGLVGVYHNWKNTHSKDETPLEILDPKTSNRETFLKRIAYEN